MGEFKIGFLKIAALWSFCGGPLLVTDRLKPILGTHAALLLTGIPVLVMLVGALFLEDLLEDRMARAAVWSGRQALYVVSAMHVYAVWRFATGLHMAEQWLYYAGIGVGLVWSIVYLHAARRWPAPWDRRDIRPGRGGTPIEPR